MSAHGLRFKDFVPLKPKIKKEIETYVEEFKKHYSQNPGLQPLLMPYTNIRFLRRLIELCQKECFKEACELFDNWHLYYDQFNFEFPQPNDFSYKQTLLEHYIYAFCEFYAYKDFSNLENLLEKAHYPNGFGENDYLKKANYLLVLRIMAECETEPEKSSPNFIPSNDILILPYNSIFVRKLYDLIKKYNARENVTITDVENVYGLIKWAEDAHPVDPFGISQNNICLLAAYFCYFSACRLGPDYKKYYDKYMNECEKFCYLDGKYAFVEKFKYASRIAPIFMSKMSELETALLRAERNDHNIENTGPRKLLGFIFIESIKPGKILLVSESNMLYIIKKKYEPESSKNEFKVLKDLHEKLGNNMGENSRIIKFLPEKSNEAYGTIAEEFAGGGTLQEYFHGRGRGLSPDEMVKYSLGDYGKALSPNEIRIIGINVAWALYNLHQTGWAHMDVKPHNIFLMKIGDLSSVRLADFDFSRQKVVTMLGTPRYIAPEIESGTGKDPRASDIFSFGAVLYGLAVGDTCYMRWKGGHQMGYFSVYDNDDGDIVCGPGHLNYDEYKKNFDGWISYLPHGISALGAKGWSKEDKNEFCKIIERMLIWEEERITAEKIINLPFFRNIDDQYLPPPLRGRSAGKSALSFDKPKSASPPQQQQQQRRKCGAPSDSMVNKLYGNTLKKLTSLRFGNAL